MGLRKSSGEKVEPFISELTRTYLGDVGVSLSLIFGSSFVVVLIVCGAGHKGSYEHDHIEFERLC